MCACVGCSNCAELPNGYCTPCKERITKGAKPARVTPSTLTNEEPRLRRLERSASRQEELRLLAEIMDDVEIP